MEAAKKTNNTTPSKYLKTNNTTPSKQLKKQIIPASMV
jgi:hypothetical protein